MERKRKVQLPDGSEVEATEMGFRTSGEHWNEYLTDDGSVLRVKLVVTEILRFDGQWDPNGNPLYGLNSTNVLAVSAPDELRKQ